MYGDEEVVTDEESFDAPSVNLRRCTPEKRKCLSLGLEILSHIVRGACPEVIYDEYCTSYTYDRAEEDNGMDEEAKRLHRKTKRDMQSQVSDFSLMS